MGPILIVSLTVLTSAPPLDEALRYTEPPTSLRAAFTLAVRSEASEVVVRYDPRGDSWTRLSQDGRDDLLEDVISDWRDAPSPDGRLFADNLRVRLGESVEARDLGAAWALDFQPQIQAGDTRLDLEARQALAGTVWYDPDVGRIVRVEYRAPERFVVAGQGRVDRLDQVYVLAQDAEFGVSHIAGFRLDIAGGRGPFRRSHSIEAQLLDVDFFFTQPTEEARWLARYGPRLANSD